jgi:hypothetical protein
MTQVVDQQTNILLWMTHAEMEYLTQQAERSGQSPGTVVIEFLRTTPKSPIRQPVRLDNHDEDYQ